MKYIFYTVSFFICIATAYLYAIRAVREQDRHDHFVIESIYGTVTVNDPLLCDLIRSPEVQRLRGIHQYGPWEYVVGPAPYNRFDHSMGTFILTQQFGGSYKEQIAALLHDVSHTIFSHAGGWIYHTDYKKADGHQDDIHSSYLSASTIPSILAKHGLTIDDIHHKKEGFCVLEQELPDICADRLDYNLQGAYIEGYIGSDDVRTILEHLHINDGRWYFDDVAVAQKFAELSLYMTRRIWGSPANGIINSLLGKALAVAHREGIVTTDDIHYGQDEDVWRTLCNSTNAEIMYLMHLMRRHQSLFFIDENNPTIHVRAKCRGIDPWVHTPEGFKRLSGCSKEFSALFSRVSKEVTTGWPLRCLAALPLDITDKKPALTTTATN